MTAAEEGVLLLCCRLGDPDAKPLTMAQFRELGLRVRACGHLNDPLAQLRQGDLMTLGYSTEQAQHIIRLLERETLLRRYLAQAERLGIVPVTRLSPAYPRQVRLKKQLSCPPVMFARGDLALLERPCVAAVGSRQLMPENTAFAQCVGHTAARERLVLVSGNAMGADQTAQDACLDQGGSCVVFLADRLMDHPPHPGILYISEDGFDLPFSAARALHRNALIHMQPDKAIAIQCTYGKGGTWEGCLDNLRHNWSSLFVFEDGSPGCQALIERGAVGIRRLNSIQGLVPLQTSLF